MDKQYALIDSGDGLKLEKFGPYLVQRPCQQAIWPKKEHLWKEKKPDLIFTREKGNQWHQNRKMPKSWEVEFAGQNLVVSPTDFGHMGIFPEHQLHYEWMRQFIRSSRPFRFLNLFAYSGAATLFMASAGAEVCHVDASKKSVEWAKENARSSHLENQPIRWIVDDALKFLKREANRRSFYQGILLDPPSFGRGSQGQVFKIEEGLFPLIQAVKSVLDPEEGAFILLTNHTPGLTALVLKNCLEALELNMGVIECGEMVIPSKEGFPIPSGTFGKWFQKR